MKVLAIETSCDDTSLAIVSYENDKFSCNMMVSFTQLDIHLVFWGVVPELASREHLHQILIVLQWLVKKSWYSSLDEMINDCDTIAVTATPWLPWSLIIWKTLWYFLSTWYSKPIWLINHLYGHVFSFLLDRDISFLSQRSIVLSVSWWHSDLSILSKNDWNINSDVYVDNLWHYTIRKIGTTRDDAIGEVYDKVSRLLWWPYPWWVRLSKNASQYKYNEEEFKDINPIRFKRILLEKDSFDFSFSGMKAQAHTFIESYKKYFWISSDWILPLYIIQHICYEFQEAASDILVKKIFMAIEKYNIRSIALVWWVSANLRLREKINLYKNMYEKDHDVIIDFYTPNSFDYCTDNAAMIWVAWIIAHL